MYIVTYMYIYIYIYIHTYTHTYTCWPGLLEPAARRQRACAADHRVHRPGAPSSIITVLPVFISVDY